MRKILFVEDDNSYRDVIADILTKEGYDVDAVATSMEGIEQFAEHEYDLVISDLMLDDVDGVRFLRYIKKIQPNIKTMILTGSPNDESEISALEIAIDKYMTKDVRVEVLLKYIEYLLTLSKKSKSEKNLVLESIRDNILVDHIARTVRKDGTEVKVTPKEYGILHVLLEKRGRAVSREEIIDAIWDKEYEAIDSRVIDVHIKSLRNKLKLQSIVAIRGYGYKWDE